MLPQRLPLKSRLGHTLVELVTAMVSSGMLLAGLGSVMLIASQVANTPTASSHRLEAAEALNEFANDARYATFLVTRTPRVLEFVVTDRTSDGPAERIRYEWSGVPGDPLLKTVNDGTPIPLVDAVQDFQLSVATASETESFTATTESAEAILASNAVASSGQNRLIDQNNFSAQRINPTGFAGIPANANAWNATRVDFKANRNGSGETLRVQIRSAGDPYDRPTGEVLGEVAILEDILTSGVGWNTATFSSPIRGLALHRMYSLVWRGTTGESGTSAALQTDDNASTSVNESNDAGATWTYMPSRQTYYRIYGTYTSPGTTYNVPRNYATRVNVMLQAGAAAHSRINASVPLVNRPELLSAYWRADFDGDPTTIDFTRDGTSDWTMASGSFNNATLAGGVWLANGALESRPKHNFTTNTTVEVRCRNTSAGGNGAVVRINADRQGGSHAPFVVRVQRQADGSQTLTLYGKSNDATDVMLLQRKNLSSDFVRYRLTILPSSDVVNLAINDTDEGTYTYPTYAPTGDDRFLTFFANTSSAEYDHVELRVAEVAPPLLGEDGFGRRGARLFAGDVADHGGDVAAEIVSHSAGV